MGLRSWGEKILNVGGKVLDAIVTVTDVAIEATFKIAEGVNTVVKGALYVGQCIFFPSAFHTALWNLCSFIVRNVFNIALIQPLSAFRDMVPTTALQEVYHSSEIQTLLRFNVPTNLALLGLILLQQNLFINDGEQENDDLEFIRNLYLSGIASKLLWVFIQRIKLHNTIDRIAINWALTDTVVKKNQHNAQFKPCEHDLNSMANASTLTQARNAITLAKGYVEYPISILGRAVQLYLLSFLVDENEPWQKYSYMALIFMDEGQSVWTYKLDSAGICPIDQQHWFNANNTYFAAWGALFHYITYLASNLVMEDNPAIFAVVHDLLYPLFIISTLTVTTPPPNKPEVGKKLVLDVFEPGREVVKFSIKKTAQVIDYFVNPDKEGSPIAAFINAASNIPLPVKAALVDPDLFTVRAMVTKRESINTLIATSGQKWQAGIDIFKRYTSGTVPSSVVPFLTKTFIPSFVVGSKAIHFAADAIFGNDLRPPLRTIHFEIGKGLKAAKERERQKLLVAGKGKAIDKISTSSQEGKWTYEEIKSENTEAAKTKENETGCPHVPIASVVVNDRIEQKSEDNGPKERTEPKIEENKPAENLEEKTQQKDDKERCAEEKYEVKQEEKPLNTHAACIKKLTRPASGWEYVSIPKTVQPQQLVTDQLVSTQPSTERDWVFVSQDGPHLFARRASNEAASMPTPAPILEQRGASVVSKMD